MSLAQTDFNEIPRRTKYLVSGYIRESERLLKNDTIIANDITLICILYTWNKSFEAARKALAIKIVRRRRPSVQDFVKEIAMPSDTEVLDELVAIARQHTRMGSAIQDLMKMLPFEAEKNRQIAETWMRHINDTEDIVNLISDSE